MIGKFGRFGRTTRILHISSTDTEGKSSKKTTYGSVWDVEKMSLPHIRRKTGWHARPYGQGEGMSKGSK